MKKTINPFGAKWLSIILCLIMACLAGCIQEQQISMEPGVDVTKEAPEPVPCTPEDEPPAIPETDDNDFINYGKEAFLMFYRPEIYNDWIYYRVKNELWKCRLVLTDETIVFSEGIGTGFNINHDGCGIVRRKADEWYIFNVIKGTIEELDMSYSPTIMSNGFLYKNNIFVENKMWESKIYLDMLDNRGDYIKTVLTEELAWYAIIEDVIYYLPFYGNTEETAPSNTIMRYDIKSGEIESVFEFELTEVQKPGDSWPDIYNYFFPYVYFYNRNIIIENDKHSFVYTSIDSIEPKKVIFNLGKDIRVVPVYSTDDDVFFFCYEEMVLGYIPSFYKVIQGTTEPLFLGEFNKTVVPSFFSDGYLYYYECEEDGNIINKLRREKFY